MNRPYPPSSPQWLRDGRGSMRFAGAARKYFLACPSVCFGARREPAKTCRSAGGPVEAAAAGARRPASSPMAPALRSAEEERVQLVAVEVAKIAGVEAW